MGKIKQVLIIGAGLFALSVNLQAQTTTPDSIVQVAAEAEGLSLVAPQDLPASGTFWEALPGGIMAPLPFPPGDASLPTYQITADVFLVDSTGGQVTVRGLHGMVMTGDLVAAALATESNAVANLIDDVQAAQFDRQLLRRSFGMADSEADGGDDLPMNSGGPPVDPNGLWLQITNVSNGWSYLNLHNATNEVYSIWSTTNLLTPFASGNVELELWPSGDQTNAMPFAIQNFGRQNLFLRAEDWTGVDSDGDGIPDWWIWKYFGDLSETATNLDSQGNALGYDYTNGLDPNVISFTISVTNNYVNSMSVPVPLNITAGNPVYYAVLVNDTNLADASWQPYTTSNLLVFLGGDGGYNVTVGLRGLPADATQTWQSQNFIEDTVAPLLVITNLANLSGSRPFIDPAGYTTKSLSSLTFDVTNSLGVAYSDQGEVVDQDCNPADMCHATNRFVCLDVALTLGTNHIAIHAADWAGNVTTTNFDYIFTTNGDTAPPVMAMTWPQDGMEISGNSFTLRGMLDDDTATVSGQWTDTNGVTNSISGLVERGGQFWLENLPLNAGTNVFTVTATDAAGNSSTTNLTLTQSGVTLTLDAVDASLLNQVRVNVTGEISDPTYAVWINGVQGYNNGNGTWGATNVPVTAGGTASFDLTAYPPAYAPAGNSWTNFAIEQLAYPNGLPADPAQASVSEDKPEVVYVKANNFQVTSHEESPYSSYTLTDDRSWSQGGGGYRNINIETEAYLNDWPGDAGDMPDIDGLGSLAYGTVVEYTNTDIGLPNVEWVDYTAGSSGVDWPDSYADDIIPITWAASGAQVVELFTGGKALRQDKCLFMLNQTLGQFAYSFWGDLGLPSGSVAPESIALGAYGNQDTNGNLYALMDSGQHVVVTPKAPQPWYGGNLMGKQKYTLASITEHTALTNTNLDRTKIGVGEEVLLTGMPASTSWTTSAGGLSDTNGGGVTFTAPSNAPTGGTIATVIATYKTASLAIPFTVVEPSSETAVKYAPDDTFSTNVYGAGMYLRVTVQPTDVCFYRVQMTEVAGPSTNIFGCFTNWDASVWYHWPADGAVGVTNSWINLNEDNGWLDHSSFSFSLTPIYPGGSDLVIPMRWRIETNSNDNPFPSRFVTFRITDNSGSAVVTKLGLEAHRP